MDDNVVIEKIEIIYSGLLQIDLFNESKGEYYRVLCEPDDFFGMIGDAMKDNLHKYHKEYL